MIKNKGYKMESNTRSKIMRNNTFNKLSKAFKGVLIMRNKFLKQILSAWLGSSLIFSQSYAFMGAGEVVFDPTTYASILESIEKYNTMIQNMQDTLDTMNRINDVMNTASNTLNNLQVGLADPTKLFDRFQSNLEGINANFNRIANGMKERDWKNSLLNTQFRGCQQRWQQLRRDYPDKYTNNKVAMEIDANLKWLETANDKGLQEANNKINEFFDDVVDKTDILNIEAHIRDRDPKQTTIDVCKMIKEQERERYKEDKKICYHQAIANKDLKKAEQCMKEYEEIIQNDKNEKINTRKKNMEKWKSTIKTNTDKPAFSINANNCSVIGGEQLIKDLKLKNEEDLYEKREVSTGEGENATKKTICIAKQNVINQLYTQGNVNDALALQNERNMALALNGDTYALQQAQLETTRIISEQINTLNQVVSAMAEMQMTEFEEKTNQKDSIKKDKEKNNKKLFDNILNTNQRNFEYNQVGLPIQSVKKDQVVGGSDQWCALQRNECNFSCLCQN